MSLEYSVRFINRQTPDLWEKFRTGEFEFKLVRAEKGLERQNLSIPA